MTQSQPSASWIPIREVPRHLWTFPAKDVFDAFISSRENFFPIQFSTEWENRFDSVTKANCVFSHTQGATIRFQVSGDKFAFLLTRNEYCGVLSICIGKATVRVDTYTQNRDESNALCLIEGLGSGEHDVVLSIIGHDKEARGCEIWLRELFLPEASSLPLAKSCRETRQTLHAFADLAPLANVANLHRSRTENIGDLFAAPAKHVPFLQNSPILDLLDWHPLHQDISPKNPGIRERYDAYFDTIQRSDLIIGGGGLLETPFFSESIELLLAASNRKLIIWGAGNNGQTMPWDQESRLFNSFNLTHDRFKLIGVRDYGTRFQWVPCASCLHPGFDQTYKIRRQFGFYLHARRSFIGALEGVALATDVLNNENTIDEVLQFLGESECIITDSFHGAYWGTLLGRKVISVPSGHKFFSLKHAVPQTGFFDWKNAVQLARSYPEALTECRDANYKFALQVYDALS